MLLVREQRYKFVFVKNTGNVDVYYRTIIAFEAPEGAEDTLKSITTSSKNFDWNQVKDGVLIFDEDKRSQLDNQHILDDLRFEREQQCFPIINRGQLWYEMLSETQVAELQLWYQAWLDVTETLLIPERPGWLT